MRRTRACARGEKRGGGERGARRGIADGMARKVNSASKVQPSGAGGGGAIANSALSAANSAPRGGRWCALVALSLVWSGSPLWSPRAPSADAAWPSSPDAPMRSTRLPVAGRALQSDDLSHGMRMSTPSPTRARARARALSLSLPLSLSLSHTHTHAQ